MTTAHLAEMEAAITRDEATNPDRYYEYQGTIDEAHARRRLTDYQDADAPVEVSYGALGI